MALINPKYRTLEPRLEFLADESVLLQAWKKADRYIRNHNWYADLLELDYTLMALPRKAKAWASSLNSGNFELDPLRVVPAPKNAQWVFGSNGVPWTVNPNGQALRPLAHVSIRDQTFAVAVMLCLADAIETLQGNTDQNDYRAAQQSKVYSYGNRLFCDWDPGTGRARHRWGNAETYTRFFQDYKRFLGRPAQVGQEWAPRLASKDQLCVVKLDVEKFYDNIDRTRLIRALKRHYKTYTEDFETGHKAIAGTSFWKCAERVLNWTWSDEDRDLASLFDADSLPTGLPQGLVAAGFFANAYLLDVDQKMGSSIGAQQDGLRILDYCRYVDDMRVVVAYPRNAEGPSALGRKLEVWVNRLLSRHKLRVKGGKTEVTLWEDFAIQGRSSEYMRSVQSQVSVVPDAATLLQTTTSLENLLALSDSLDVPDVSPNPLELARISGPRMDVRDDTIKRFVANRLAKVIRMRRRMTPRDPASGHMAESGLDALDHEMETVARKLIAAWARNPALVTVLRCGLDLFPDPLLLQPVITALRQKMDDNRSQANEVHACRYIVAELLKAGSVESGYRDHDLYPRGCDIDGYRAELKSLALDLLRSNEVWFVSQQAALFLASQNHSAQLPDGQMLDLYQRLHIALRYGDLKKDRHLIPIALTVQRIKYAPRDFALWFGKILAEVPIKRANEYVHEIGANQPDLLVELLRLHGPKNPPWRGAAEALIPAGSKSRRLKSLTELGNEEFPLDRLVASPQNPFVQEAALVKLAIGILKALPARNFETLGLRSFAVSCDDWSRVQAPRIKITVSCIEGADRIPEDFGDVPPWCRKSLRWAYTVGRLLRSAAIGGDDYMNSYAPARDSLNPYKGLRSNWFKRRLGFAVSTEGRGAEPVPISAWINELILCLMQWPGLQAPNVLVKGFSRVRRPDDLMALLRRRLVEIDGLYAHLSDMPLYLVPTRTAQDADLSKFRVAIVQSLLPRMEDFSPKDPTGWTPQFRAAHRAHLAAICRLIHQQLSASVVPDIRKTRSEAHLDLIVFPELAIHADDFVLMRSLSDRTKAAIFAGQTHCHLPHLSKPINRAVWFLRQQTRSGRQFITLFQGKKYVVPAEIKMGVIGHRPYQILVEFQNGEQRARVTGAICYDATDLKLAADLRDRSDAFVIAALNKAVTTFDTMTEALQYHMYQPVILANTGEYGGSSAQAPYTEPHQRLITQLHGNNQASVTVFEVDLLAFKSKHQSATILARKSPPAGFAGRY